MNQPPSLITISYPVLPGRDDDFQTWLRGANQLATRQPGFLGVGVDWQQIRPTEREWKVTYKFETEAECEAWARHEEHLIMRKQAADLFTAAPIEMRGGNSGSARMLMVVTSRVGEAQLANWQAAQSRLNEAVAKFPGFDSLDVFKPRADSDEWTTVLTFRSADDLRRWNESDERRTLLNELEEAQRDEVRIEPGAFGQWFSANATPAASSPAWKQAMVVLLVLYPLVTLFNITIGNIVGRGLTVAGHPIFSGLGLPFPAVIFLGNAVGTALLTWVVMPVICRVLDWWLNPFASRENTIKGASLLVFLYAVEIAVTLFVYRVWGF